MVLVDSTGVELALHGGCTIGPTEQTPRFYDCGGSQTGYLLIWDRFIAVGIGCIVGGDLDTGREGTGVINPNPQN